MFPCFPRDHGSPAPLGRFIIPRPPCLSPFPHETGGFETDPSPPSIRSPRYQAQSKGRDEVATMASSTRAVILLLFCLSDQAVRHTQGVVFVRSKAVACATALVCGDQDMVSGGSAWCALAVVESSTFGCRGRRSGWMPTGWATLKGSMPHPSTTADLSTPVAPPCTLSSPSRRSPHSICIS